LRNLPFITLIFAGFLVADGWSLGFHFNGLLFQKEIWIP